jgi:two-component system, LuxR family, response regulator FixJ
MAKYAANSMLIHVVDDDDSVRHSICVLLGAHGYETCSHSSADEFLTNWNPDIPSCVLVDIKMPRMDGIELHEEINRRRMRCPVIMLTGHGDVPAAVRSMKAGAVDFIEKPADVADLLAAIDQAALLISGKMATALPREEVVRRLSLLTGREREVLDHLVLGKINKQIAEELGISQRTVEVHRSRVREKLEAKGLADMVRMMSTPLGNPH